MPNQYTGYPPLEIRFWLKVDTSGECWLWTGGTDKKGYGKVHMGRDQSPHFQGAHRVAYTLRVGPVPDGLWVLHNCPSGDNPTCVNPAHLWLGTSEDNVRDMHAKGRARNNPPTGERHPQAKLTEADARAIRTRYAQGGVSQNALACEYRVSKPSIRSVIHGKTWRQAI